MHNKIKLKIKYFVFKTSLSFNLADTRKRSPCFRVEKNGTLVGGCGSHRRDLRAMTLLKNNHYWSASSNSKAVSAARSDCGFTTMVEDENAGLQARVLRP